MYSNRLLLIGCEILRQEIDWLIQKHHWPVETLYLDSTLHCGLDRLAQALQEALAANRHRQVLVFYGGGCHPRIEDILRAQHTFRTEGQNCIEMILGPEMFQEELRNGAYFLFEDWARRWDEVMTKAFGTSNREIVREIFQGDRSHLLCLRTPGSRDFAAEAEQAGQSVGLPLKWRDVTLEHLEAVLEGAVTQGLQAAL